MKRLILIIMLVSASAILSHAQTGKISGKLTYPSDGIPPDTVLCVIDAASNGSAAICSNAGRKALLTANVAFKLNFRSATYEVSLPAGSYFIFSMTREMSGHRAYYNEFVKCGMSVECKSTKRIAVRVKPRITTRGITVGDYWN